MKTTFCTGLAALALISVPAQALELVCKGSAWLYRNGTPGQKADASVQIDESNSMLTLRGMAAGSASAKYDAEPERMGAFLPLAHNIDGRTFPYSFVNLDRYTGEILVMALLQPELGNPTHGLFQGKCTRQQRMF